MSTPDVFTDWDGTKPLKANVVAASMRWLRNRILRLEDMGLQAEGVADRVMAADGRSFYLTSTTGRQLSTIPLPAAPWKWRPEGRIVGARYDTGDMFYVPATRSSYITLVGHVAAAALSTDVTANRLALAAMGGTDAQTYAGNFNPDAAYSKGAVVSYTTPSGDQALWQAFDDVGPTSAPSNSFSWQRVSVSTPRDLRERWKGPIAAGDAVLSTVVTRFTLLASGLVGSLARMTPAAPAAVAFDVKVDGAVIGTMSFAANSTKATFSTVAQAQTFVSPDSLVEVVAKAAVPGSVSLSTVLYGQ